MKKKGQGAMEYLMTYGWAILVVIIVGVVLWQMGIFNPSGGTAPGMSGFTTVKPNEWACDADGDLLKLVLVNAAGQQVSNVTAGTITCAATLAAGDTVTCELGAGTDTTGTCATVNAGDRYEETVTLSYTTSGGLARESTGTVWGPAE